MKEIWKDIIGYKGLYRVSDMGRVKSLERIVINGNGSTRIVAEKILNIFSKPGRYSHVSLSFNGVVTTRTIHQVVAEAFLNHKPNGCKIVVNHINFIRNDNRLENLEIVTFRENNNHKHIPHSSRYTGVYWNKRINRWHSRIYINGKQKHLGYFIDEIEAHLAYEYELSKIKLQHD